jgi:TRAP-type C4-dicarboxylate transport system permease small subunit
MARALAITGGVVLIALIVLTCLSVIGRILNGIGHAEFIENNLAFVVPLFRAFGPINGDYELVEAGIALAIFLFLPWCQLNRGHATVELFTAKFPSLVNRWLALLWEVVFAATILLITWRLYVGMTDKMRYGETTFLLQMPVWWPFAACSIAAVLASVISLYTVYLRARETFSDPSPAPEAGSTGP